jgi:predicted nucleotide-binding protein (sugar kinase/HSP70/actin superfamily)
MPSESVCYPAKLSHGHVQNLLAKDVDAIWMPCVRWERQEDPAATNHYNCPIVMSYPQALELNVDELATSRTLYCCPFVPYDDKRELKRRLYEEVVEKLLPQVQARRAAAAAAGVAAAGDAAAGVAEKCGEAAGVTAGSEGAAGAAAAAGDVAPAASQPEALLGVESRAFEPLTRAEIDAAVNAAWEEDQRFKQAMRDAGDACLAWIECHDGHGIVLAGRPYHQDPEVNHAIPELIHGFGFAVLTEDSVAHKTPVERPIRVVDQWMYHSRLYRAARFVAGRNDLDLIQLNSFGCGLDALTCDQVQEILEASGKIYTVLKIDEVSNLGACRIRVRSLMAALANQKAELAAATPAGEEPPREREAASAAVTKVRYTKEMREEGYTILCPQMAPIHFELVEPIVRRAGYNLVLLPSVDAGAVEAGLKYVNNDICYPSILVTGQIMEAIESGQYDLNRTAVLITQTGGGCRATNYIALIRKALKESGHANVPVVSLAVAAGLDEKNPGFKLLTPDVLIHACYALLYGDLIMQALYRTRPYEASPGEANALYRWFMDRAARDIPTMTPAAFYRLCDETVHAFDTLPLVDDRSKPRVGVVGEILVKFHPTANNQVVEVIEREGCEAVVPGLVDFFLFGLTSPQNTKDELGSSAKKRLTHNAAISFIEGLRAPINQLLEKSERFEPYVSIWDLASEANEVLSLCNTMGEGWLLTAEMIDLIKTGTPNIVCASPFACLPNHVVGKSVIKRLKQLYPAANIVAIDYDPGASEVNQLNRIKLMISVAQERANDAATAPAEKNREVEALV